MSRKPKREGDGLAGMLKAALEQEAERAAFEADYTEVMSSSRVADFTKLLLREAIFASPVSFNRAVDLISEAPLMHRLREIGPELFRQNFDNPVPLAAATLPELYQMARDDTRETADLSRLIEAAKTEIAAFDACKALAQQDLRRPGMPNWQLRQWVSGWPTRPARRGPIPKHVLRDACLALLIADAANLGFSPTRNDNKKSNVEDSACDVVRTALMRVGLPDVGYDVCKGIWKNNHHRIPWYRGKTSDDRFP